MCDLYRPVLNKSVTGYKVVAKKKSNGKYYSVAFGFEYKNPVHRFGVRRNQNQIGYYFIQGILSIFNPYLKNHMSTRTACFRRIQDAKAFHKTIKSRLGAYGREYDVTVVKVRLSEKIMTGHYDYFCLNRFGKVEAKVYAGKRMEILEEVN